MNLASLIVLPAFWLSLQEHRARMSAPLSHASSAVATRAFSLHVRAGGDAIWLSLAVWGLAALASTFHMAFLVLKYAGVAYLIYLSWKMWVAPWEKRQTTTPFRVRVRQVSFYERAGHYAR